MGYDRYIVHLVHIALFNTTVYYIYIYMYIHNNSDVLVGIPAYDPVMMVGNCKQVRKQITSEPG